MGLCAPTSPVIPRGGPISVRAQSILRAFEIGKRHHSKSKKQKMKFKKSPAKLDKLDVLVIFTGKA